MAATIELYLIRHAIAAERGPNYPDDRERPLTSEGIARFKQAVDGMKQLDCVVELVLTSPLVRAAHTAELLVSGLAKKPRIEQLDALAPGGRLSGVLDVIGTFTKRYRRIALVGHQPDLGELAAKLLQARGEIEFKKGAVCCIELDGALPNGPGVLRWLMPPKALRKMVR
jgi:phosphohistidine phosphatase